MGDGQHLITVSNDPEAVGRMPQSNIESGDQRDRGYLIALPDWEGTGKMSSVSLLPPQKVNPEEQRPKYVHHRRPVVTERRFILGAPSSPMNVLVHTKMEMKSVFAFAMLCTLVYWPGRLLN